MKHFTLTLIVLCSLCTCAKDPPEIIDVVVVVKPDGGAVNDGGSADVNVDSNGDIMVFPDGYIDPPDRCRPLVYSRDCLFKALDGLNVLHCTDGVDEVYPACTVYHPETHQAIAYCKPDCGKTDGGSDTGD